MASTYSSSKSGSGQISLAYRIIPKLILFFVLFFVASLFIVMDYRAMFIPQRTAAEDAAVVPRLQRSTCEDVAVNKSTNNCENQDRPRGSESLPGGIISATSNFEMLPLLGPSNKEPNVKRNLLAIAVGVKQKENVDKMVKKFKTKDFAVILFHYDGIVENEWSDFEWSHEAIHISANNQTKWWFAKRFLHPDIVVKYDYIFLWDEDLGVENFDPGRYISIVKEEGLEISQPGIDPKSLGARYKLTKRNEGSKVHRRAYGWDGKNACNDSSRVVPCTGFVEMMAPVFSKAAWRCTWYLIQSDMVYGWGVDLQLGHCAQGDPTEKVGIVDSEYIFHLGVLSLGGSQAKQANASAPSEITGRALMTKLQFRELGAFKNRWRNAVDNDKCWVDLFKNPPGKMRRER